MVTTEEVPVCGNPDPDRICTSHVEEQNFTMRTNIRRFTRLTASAEDRWAARAVLRLLQLLSFAQNDPRYSCDVSGDFRSRLGPKRSCWRDPPLLFRGFH